MIVKWFAKSFFSTISHKRDDMAQNLYMFITGQDTRQEKKMQKDIGFTLLELMVVIAMKIGGMTRELANNCVLDSLDDKSCNLVLNPGHIQLVSLKSEENLQQALQQYYGNPIKLNIKTV